MVDKPSGYDKWTRGQRNLWDTLALTYGDTYTPISRDLTGRERSTNIIDKRDTSMAESMWAAMNPRPLLRPNIAAYNLRGIFGGEPKKLTGTVGSPMEPALESPFARIDHKRYSAEEAEAAGYYVPPITGSAGNDTLRGGNRARVIDTIIAEAVGDGKDGMQAVAFAIANRARKSGKSLYEVVSAPSQFEGFSNPGSGVRGAINNPKTRAQVEQLLDAAVNQSVPDPLKGGTMFHAKSATPYWADEENKHGTVRIGRQTFYLGNDPVQTAAVSPAVPPRRPDSSISAVAAIESLLGTPPQSATAYAPPSGSLQANNPPQGLALPGTPPRPPAPFPAPGMAPPIPSQAALPPMPPWNAMPPPAPPNILAQEPPAPNTVRPGMPGAMPPMPPSGLPPQLDEQLLRRYAETRDPATFGMPPSASPKPRTVQTVPIDPTTGGIAAPSIPTTLKEAQRQQALRVAATSDPAVDTNADTLRRRYMENIASTDTPGKPPEVRRTSFGEVRFDQSPRIPTTLAEARAEQLATRQQTPKPPTQRVSPNGVPVYQPSLDATALPYTPKAPKPFTGPMPDNGYRPPLPPKPPSLHAFGDYMPGGIPNRLTPQPGTGNVPPPSLVADIPKVPRPGAGSWLRTEGFGPPMAGAPMQPGYQPGVGFPPEETPLQVANAFGYEDANGTTKRPTPIKDLLAQINSPGHQLLGQMNMGKKPILSALAKMFMPNPNRPQIASSRSTRPSVLDAQRYWVATGGVRSDTPPPLSVYGDYSKYASPDWNTLGRAEQNSRR